MNVRQLVPALTLTLALASQPVLAQGHRGGGSRGGHGGGHGGSRGSAVARNSSGRPGYAPRTAAQQRHPRPGTGYGYGYGYNGGRSYGSRGYGYRGYGYRGHGYYRPYYGYRPYYSYPYYPYPYYSSYWPGLSLSFGWGYGSSYAVGASYGGPGYSVGVSAPYGAAGGYDSGEPPPAGRDAERSYEGRSGRVRLEVRPEDASVYVDNEFRGTARDTRILTLPPGRHLIELVRPGFAVERREVAVASGESQDVFVELLRP